MARPSYGLVTALVVAAVIAAVGAIIMMREQVREKYEGHCLKTMKNIGYDATEALCDDVWNLRNFMILLIMLLGGLLLTMTYKEANRALGAKLKSLARKSWSRAKVCAETWLPDGRSANLFDFLAGFIDGTFPKTWFPVFCEIVDKNKKKIIKTIVFIGSPDGGKSTLLNGFPNKELLLSASDGTELTCNRIEDKENGSLLLLDTDESNEAAMKEIRQKLKTSEGLTKVVIVFDGLTDSKENRQERVKIVLDAVPEISSYGIVVHEADPKDVKAFRKDAKLFMQEHGFDQLPKLKDDQQVYLYPKKANLRGVDAQPHLPRSCRDFLDRLAAVVIGQKELLTKAMQDDIDELKDQLERSVAEVKQCVAEMKRQNTPAKTKELPEENTTVQWMWGDATKQGRLFILSIAKYNFFRWSTAKDIEKTIVELQVFVDEDKQSTRSVYLCIKSKKQEEIYEFSTNVAAALEKLREQVHEAENSKLRSLAENLTAHEADREALASRLEAQVEAARRAELAKDTEVAELRNQLARPPQLENDCEWSSDCSTGTEVHRMSSARSTARSSVSTNVSRRGSKSNEFCSATPQKTMPTGDMDGSPIAEDCPVTPINLDLAYYADRDADSAPAEQFVAKASDLGKVDLKLTPVIERIHCEKIEVKAKHLQKSLRESEAREAELQQQLQQERELHEGAIRLLSCHKVEGVKHKSELQQDLSDLSNCLEQKEEDIMEIKFDMVELQNRLVDQFRLVSENADAFQQASEELADKDERLSDALTRQAELLSQMNSMSDELQEKVGCLSQELDGSRASYQALEEHTRTVVSDLENERDNLVSEIARLRLEACDVSSLRSELLNMTRNAEEWKEQTKKEEARSKELAATLAQLQEQHAKSLEQGASQQQDFAQDITKLKQLEASLQEALRSEAEKANGFKDELSTADERLALAVAQIQDLASALERAQFIERQAVDRAQEYRTSLELYREFGNEDFMQSPPRAGEFPSPRAEACDERESPQTPTSPSLKKVLISVDMDLGFDTATLNIAPWQTRADFDDVVEEFLEEHKVRPVFADALVRYLEEVEANAVTFPCHVSANLVDVYSRYS